MNEPVILLVEDNEDDVFFMSRALNKANVACPLQVATNGQEALEYLAGEGKYSDRNTYPLPSVVFLDLKLPYMHGFEVLHWIQQQPFLKQLHVVVLTSSPEKADRQKAKDLGAKAYLVKPPTEEMIHQALHFLPSLATA